MQKVDICNNYPYNHTVNAQKIGKALGFVSRQQSRYLVLRIGHLGISPRLLPYFMTVSRFPGIPQKELAEKIAIDKTQTTKAVDCLERCGYVERRKEEGDQRINGLFLTAEGRKILPEVREVLDSIDELLSGDFDDADIDTFLRILEAFGKALHDACDAFENKEEP